MHEGKQHYRCGIYARVSTDIQAAQEDGSLDLQLERMRRELQHRNSIHNAKRSYEIIDEYREDGVSGKSLDRPELNRLKEDIQAGRINAVVFCKIDRLSRSLLDFFGLASFFDDHNVYTLCLDEEFDTSTPTGRAILKILLVFAELEREQTSERTKSAMRERAMKGLHNGGRIWGYDLDPDRKGYLIVNQERAAEIRLMFEKYIELGSTDEVLKYLHRNDIKSPIYESRRGQSQGGSPVYKQTLINILRNQRYVGKVQHENEIYPGKHEAIIPEALFDEVQRRLNNYAQVRKPRKVSAKGVPHYYILRGLIRCGGCQSVMTPKPGKGYPYYVCTRVTNSASTKCDTPHLPAVAIENHVLERLRQLSLDTEEVKRLLSNAKGREITDLEQQKRRVQKLAKLLAAKKKKLGAWHVKIVDAGPEAMQEPWYEAVRDLQGEVNSKEKEYNQALAILKGLEVRQTSEKVVLDAYWRFGELLNTDNRNALSNILPLIIETLMWTPTPDPDKPGKFIGGTYKMALFDNPLFPKDKDGNVLTVDDLSSSQGQKWLPG